jgi:hypothetical protein
MVIANHVQVAYLMADISSVKASDIKEISDSLEGLNCRPRHLDPTLRLNILTSNNSPNYDKSSLLDLE